MEYNNVIMIEDDKDFIPVYKTEKGTNIVYGRELYNGLSVAKDFTSWIKDSLERVDAIENKDYFRFPFKRGGNNATLYEYIIKVETAKEICLIAGASPRANKELKEKSKAYRRYLIGIEEKYKNNIIKDNNVLDEIKQLRKEIEELNKKINLLTMDNSSKTKIINDKENTIINDFNYSRFLNHINSFSNDTKITKKEYIKLFNSYNFYHEAIGITILNKFMNENELIYGNDRITNYAKNNNILTRDNYKNHSKVFLTKEGILYITNLIINYMPKEYKIKRG